MGCSGWEMGRYLCFLGGPATKTMNKFSERVHSLRSRTPKKAKATICRLVLNLRSQFLQSRLFFSNQEKLRFTTHRFGNTAKRCNSFRLAISTSAPINACTDEANALPVYRQQGFLVSHQDYPCHIPGLADSLFYP